MDWLFFSFLVICSLLKFRGAGGTVVVAENRVRFLRQATDEVVLAGSDVELPCYAVAEDGRRLSTQWLKNRSILKAHAISGNGSLILRNVQIEQEGDYQCAILSERHGVVLSVAAKLTIAKISRFTAEPQDVVGRVGGTARFACAAADAVPSVSVEWFSNDLPLPRNILGKYNRLSSGSLLITDVRPSDRGSYYCVASNIAGNITSRSATLTTSPYGPAMEQSLKVIKAPSNVSVITGQSALFECFFEAAHSVVWRRIDQKPVSSNAYRIGSNLVIDDVTSFDEGAYACVGIDNRNKTETLTAHLSVDSAPVIKQYPEEKLCRRGESRRFHCDVVGKPPPEIVWFKDGELLRSYGRTKIYPNEKQPPEKVTLKTGETHYKRDLLISSIQQEDVAIYQCFAINALGAISAAAALTYNDSGQAAATEGPRNLKGNVMPDQRRLKLTWEPPFLNPEFEVRAFIIHFHESASGSENTAAVRDIACENNSCSEVCCDEMELTPYTNYTFWVDALLYRNNNFQFSLPTEPVIITSGDGVSLSVAPLTLEETVTTGSVRLSWSSPPVAELQGELLEYRIEVKVENPKTVGESVWRIVPFHTTEYIYSGLVPESVVLFRVIPRTRAGYPDLLPESLYPWLRYKTRAINDSQEMPRAPLVTIDALNASSLLVQWKPSGKNVSVWVISARKPTDGTRLIRSEVESTNTSVILQELDPDTLYHISVMGLNANGEEGLETIRLARTSLLAPENLVIPSAPVIIPFPTPACESAGAGKLKVFWSTPPMNIVRFAVRYSMQPEEHEALNVTAHVKIVETSLNFVMFNELAPGRSYLFATRAENRHGYSSGFSDDIICVIPLTKPPPPQVVNLKVINNSTLFVSWSATTAAEVSDVLYYVRYSANIDDANNWQEITVNGSNTSVLLFGLNTSNVYFVSVSAENEAGRGPESPTKVAHFGATGNSSSPPSKVIFQTSYKEGIIIGACIGVVCAVICAIILAFRSRREYFWCVRRADRQNANSTKATNGYVSNGHCGIHRIELEMQTLLPRLIENTQSDSKGGFKSELDRTFSHMNCTVANGHHLTYLPENLDENSSEQAEQLVVSVQAPRDETTEQSSDLSHSPATGSSLHSWTRHNGDCANGIYKNCRGSASMPNLFDSGIGFDDASAVMSQHVNCVPGRSPLREHYDIAHCDVTMANGILERRNSGKLSWLRDLLIKQQKPSRMTPATCISSSFDSRAPSQCTC